MPTRGCSPGAICPGDAAIAWVQGSGEQTRIMAAQLFQSPGGLEAVKSPRYQTTVNPVLQWTSAAERWGSPQYVVKANGVVIATTTATEIRSPVALSQGRTTWQVTAVNRAGLTSLSKPESVFVDSLAPLLSVQITGKRQVGSIVRVKVERKRLSSRRATLGRLGRQVSAAALERRLLKTVTIKHRASHIYLKRGTYRVTVTVRDRAGNKTVVTRKVRIKARPKRKAHRRKAPKR